MVPAGRLVSRDYDAKRLAKALDIPYTEALRRVRVARQEHLDVEGFRLPVDESDDDLRQQIWDGARAPAADS